jgi:hypothetical protein
MPEAPGSHVDLPERPTFAHLATVRPDRSPPSSVMWFAWDGSRIHLTHTRTWQKFANLTHEPRVALSIAEIRGIVEKIEDDPGAEFYLSLQADMAWTTRFTTQTCAWSSRSVPTASSPSAAARSSGWRSDRQPPAWLHQMQPKDSHERSGGAQPSGRTPPEQGSLPSERHVSCSRWWSRSLRRRSSCRPGASWCRR